MSDKKQISDEIRVRITYYRKKKGLTQNEVADAIGMARSTYSYYEAKAVHFPPDFLNKLAEVLGISPNTFNVETRPDNTFSFITLSDTKSKYDDAKIELSGKEKLLINIYRSLSSNAQSEALKYLINRCVDHLDDD